MDQQLEKAQPECGDGSAVKWGLKIPPAPVVTSAGSPQGTVAGNTASPVRQVEALALWRC